MLNKELLMVGITERKPHIILTADSFYDASLSASSYGYSRYAAAGLLSRIPCWETFGTMLNYTALAILATLEDPLTETIISWRNPFHSSRIVITRLDTGKSVEFVNPDSATSSLIQDGIFFKAADQGRSIPLVFDPAPDYYLDPATGKPIV